MPFSARFSAGLELVLRLTNGTISMKVCLLRRISHSFNLPKWYHDGRLPQPQRSAWDRNPPKVPFEKEVYAIE